MSPKYDEAQRTERNRFQVLLHDLCRGVPEPTRPQTGGRWYLRRDILFAMTYEVFSIFSARRFHCDLQDAYEKGRTDSSQTSSPCGSTARFGARHGRPR